MTGSPERTARRRKAPRKKGSADWEDDTVLKKQSPHLIDDSGSLGDEALPDTMGRLQLQLLSIL